VIVVIIGALIAVGPGNLDAFAICGSAHMGEPACHTTAAYERVVGAIIVILGVAGIVSIITNQAPKVKSVIGVLILILGIVSLLVVYVIAPVCGLPMTCAKHAGPALATISAILIIISVIYIFVVSRKGESGTQ
ncbi:MAG: DUF4418 family protein, partial [Candidatus Methanoplasma sp.]|nr:DUF4418 family protein [Candidatus Methanoplasma sp.]